LLLVHDPERRERTREAALKGVAALSGLDAFCERMVVELTEQVVGSDALSQAALVFCET
jgi:hypothetical protein